ncbi:uncharacterized protein LOC34617521 [Cyclospora cayetanensis]|uniref:Uncharacterized protein LOC34617521 n=1 Tax=Cyclospora cayetanensis TaxID=88456 RepID=A0A6P6RTU2_9EIME|nr:uncharacterized protein LOC34617521 [Cyclospora cayetanensis]
MSHGSSTIKVGFLGGGKMAKAIAAAIVRAGMCSASDINMSSRTEDSMKAIAALGYKAGTNTEARLSTGFCMNSCNEDAKALLLRVLKAFGPVHAISEDLFDAYSAISGSSPAFVCTFIEAMIDGGVKCGLPRQLATEAALQSVRGTAILAQTSGVHPALIRDDITSPGGTTIAGVLAMERRALRAAVAEGVEAACDRSKEIRSLLEARLNNWNSAVDILNQSRVPLYVSHRRETPVSDCACLLPALLGDPDIMGLK